MLPLLARSGATHLLVEYEDMFPFWGPLSNISATTAYTVKEVAELVAADQTDIVVEFGGYMEGGQLRVLADTQVGARVLGEGGEQAFGARQQLRRSSSSAVCMELLGLAAWLARA